MIAFACHACRKKLRVKDELAGRTVKCPGCGAVVAISGLAEARTPRSGGSESLPAPVDIIEPPTLPPRSQSDATIDAVPRPGAETAEFSPASFLAPPELPDEIGRLGGYRVLHVLGQGGMGMVFQAEDAALKRKIALKTMLPALAANKSAKERFLREAQSAAAIEHEHIITIFQVSEDRGVPFLAMPLLKGRPLDAELRDRKSSGPLTVDEAVRIAREIAEGLAAAHENGLIHRDIKPGNVWLEGDRRKVKILDFGLARAAKDVAHLTQSGAIVGTPSYMAPEQARRENVDGRADLFSLGCILYEMLIGRRAFTGHDTMSVLTSLALDTPTPPAEINTAVPADVSDITMRLLEKKPDDRFGSAADAAEALRTVGLSAAVTTKPRKKAVSLPQGKVSLKNRSKSRRGLVLTGGGLVVVISVAVALVSLLKHMPSEVTQPPPKTVVAVQKSPIQKSVVPKSTKPHEGASHVFALAFDGANQFIETPRATLPLAKPWTAEGWFNPSQIPPANATRLMSGKEVGINLGVVGPLGPRYTVYYPRSDKDDKGYHSDAPATVKQRVHLALVHDGKTIRFYVNGQPQGEPRPVKFDDIDAPFAAGPSQWSATGEQPGFFGLMHFTRLSKTARYTGPFTPSAWWLPDVDTIALYHCFEDTGTVLKDRSANGLHGTVTGARWAYNPTTRTARDLIPLADIFTADDRADVPGFTGKNEWAVKTPGVLSYTSDGKPGKVMLPVSLGGVVKYSIEAHVRRLDPSPAPFSFDLFSNDKMVSVGIHLGKRVELAAATPPQAQVIGLWPADVPAVNRSVAVELLVSRLPTFDELQVRVDNKLAAAWEGRIADIGRPIEYHPRWPGFHLPSIFCFQGTYEFANPRLKVYEGEAKRLRAEPK